MKSKWLTALALLLSLCAAPAALVMNGSFEAASGGATLSYIELSPGSTYIPGWTTTNAGINLDGPLIGISPTLTAAQGSDFLDLTGNYDSPPYGGVFQTIVTTPGQPYQISFEVGSDNYYDSYYTGTFEAPVVTLALNGAAVFSATNNFPGLANYWQAWSFVFTASATNTTIMFTGENTRRLAYIGLDNVIVAVTNLPQSSLATTIDPVNHYAYGANTGWVDSRGDTNHGAVIGQYVCSGNIYSANVGWINLGNGAPTNQIYYQNLSGNDFGVNQDGLGNLRGYAYGANIGWINFESTGAPRVNLRTGVFSGSVWSANCGWISLSNAVAYVQTDTISPGTLATNGLPIAWLLTYFTNLNINPNADPTGKGMTIAQDYAAGTNPNDANSILAITGWSFSPGGTSAMLAWDSVPTRYYYIQETLGLNPANWTDNGVELVSPSAGSTTTASFSDTSAADRFYRIQPVQPLVP